MSRSHTHVSVHQLHELNVIDIVLKELATQLCFNPYLRKPHNLSGVLESWHGFYQRIRSTLIGLSQNVDLSSLGFIEPLAVINTVAQILLQFGPWNMANKLVEIVPSGLVLFNLQKLPVKSVSVQGHVKDICSICWDSSGQWIASASEDDVRVWSLMMDRQCFSILQCH
ncbi:protein argonaute [Trifolium repens]|nr:protein argonaute [Trifolium repens]